MNYERRTDEGILKRTIKAINISEEKALEIINSHNVKSESGDDETIYTDFAYIMYVTPYDTGIKAVKIYPQGQETDEKTMERMSKIKDKILELQLPDEVKSINPPTYGWPRDTAAMLASFKTGIPYGIIAFGNNKKNTKEEVVTMFTVSGQIPSKVLGEIQGSIRATREIIFCS